MTYTITQIIVSKISTNVNLFHDIFSHFSKACTVHASKILLFILKQHFSQSSSHFYNACKRSWNERILFKAYCRSRNRWRNRTCLHSQNPWKSPHWNWEDQITKNASLTEILLSAQTCICVLWLCITCVLLVYYKVKSGWFQ